MIKISLCVIQLSIKIIYIVSFSGFQVMWDEASHTSGILSLIALILNAWKYKSSISATLSGNLDSLCASLDLRLKEKDIASWSQVN